MNILLTGHKGFIGSALLTRLARLNHKVHTIDIADSIDQDLLYYDKWPADIELVIHLAGKSGVRESLTDPAGYWMNNIEASRRLFEKYADTRILYASSSSAYEPDLNPYAASKYVLEELAERYSDTLGMRFHTVYSDNCPRENMFFKKLREGRLEYVTTHHRDFVHLQDVLDAIEILIKATHVNGTIDIGTGAPVRIQDLAPNVPVRLNTPGERTFTCANTKKIKDLGWKPKYFIENFLTKEDKGNIINITNGEPL
ncbi:MAG: NAD-dependent epimerase/dehydratase family protein [Methylophagaceae bacterium]|jgi:nucleoside-diphosphate-sugar epimerase|tara:strand:+ start:685 stop:1452 length:768 start_codon:yes stop_codon:yes gene_type:complete